ncbi:MAG: hypothetical protein KIT09_25020 [Bryobacteraceae bacterium]|nr:hypothetical protein [Bryobacteraceae bacterium]
MLRVAATRFNKPYHYAATFNGLSGRTDSLAAAVANTAVVRSAEAAVYPVFLNLSLYFQDVWQATERTAVTFGLRWDINPAPSARKGQPLLALATDGYALTRFEPLYRTSWRDIGPRLGLSYLMDDTAGREMTFRVGAALLHDPLSSSMIRAFSAAPFTSDRILTLANFPLTPLNLQPPELPASRPYGQVTAVAAGFKPPAVYQWNATLERMFGPRQALSFGYIGVAGQRLFEPRGWPTFRPTTTCCIASPTERCRGITAFRRNCAGA